MSTSNSCTRDGDCARYQIPNLSCSSGKCIAFANEHSLARLTSAPYTANTPFTLVVSVPDTSPLEASSTIVLSNTQLVLAQPSARQGVVSPCESATPDGTCIAITGVASVTGDYETDQLTAQQVSLVVNQGGGRTSLPVHVTFRPLTTDATTATTFESTGIPAIPIFAPVTNVLATAEPPRGPNATQPVAWQTWLPAGRYTREIAVDPPFNEAFPPWADVISVNANRSDQVRLGAPPEPNSPPQQGTPIDTRANRTYNITTGNVPLTGWSVFIRNTATGRTISSTRTFGAVLLGSQTVVLNTVTPSLAPIPPPLPGLPGDELVLAPPPGVLYPTLVSVAIGGSISDQIYPSIKYAPALVQGIVHAATPTTDAGGSSGETPVSARIDFISKPGAGNLSQSDNNFDLRYRASLHTAADGSYSVTLPRTADPSKHPDAAYDVIITPDQGTGYAVTFTTLIVAEDVAAGDHLVQSGIGLAVNLPAQISGRVTLTDGRPLGGVVVEAHPSVGQFPKDIIPAELESALPAVMPVERSPSTTTDANGFYSMPADPGIYDVFAKPPSSTGFAWGVTTAHEVLPTTDPTSVSVTDVDIAVPAPLDATMRLYVFNSSVPLAGALVRAYAPGPPNGNGAQIQIGQGMTDSNGVLTLFLPPYLPK